MSAMADQTPQTTYPACVACGSTENERRADRRMRSGWSSYCRACANAKSLEWKRNNQERQLATTKAWREANPEKVKQYRAKPEVREQERAAALKWRHENQERAKANDAAWRVNNPEKARLKDQKRRAMKLGASDGSTISACDIEAMLADQHGMCAYCKCKLNGKYHIDHFVPLARDGLHSRDNLILSCPSCNLQKGAKPPLQFMNTKEPSKIKNTEAREQSLVVIWSHRKAVRDLMPELKWLHHSPNGEKRDAITGNKLKAMGVKKGWPDLILPVRVGSTTGLVIEMKSATGSTTPEQKEWLEHFGDQGWHVQVCRSALEARTILCQYLGIAPSNAPALED